MAIQYLSNDTATPNLSSWSDTPIAVPNGGTGQATAQAAYNALAPVSGTTPALGDIQYFDGTDWVVLPAPNSLVPVFLKIISPGTAPTWAAS